LVFTSAIENHIYFFMVLKFMDTRLREYDGVYC